jgi:hypothetical protein
LIQVRLLVGLQDIQLFESMEKHASTHGITKLFAYYKELAEKAVAQVKDEYLHTVLGADGNSIAVVMRHIAGNLRSRFTDFLTSDGEKPSRDREGEFTETQPTRAALMEEWEGAWAVFFKEVGPLGEGDMGRTVLIRNEPHTVLDALHRQLGALRLSRWAGRFSVAVFCPRKLEVAFDPARRHREVQRGPGSLRIFHRWDFSTDEHGKARMAGTVALRFRFSCRVHLCNPWTHSPASVDLD